MHEAKGVGFWGDSQRNAHSRHVNRRNSTPKLNRPRAEHSAVELPRRAVLTSSRQLLGSSVFSHPPYEERLLMEAELLESRRVH
jgi:hypothetical protein